MVDQKADFISLVNNKAREEMSLKFLGRIEPLLELIINDVWENRTDIQFLLGFADLDLSLSIKDYIALQKYVLNTYSYVPNFVTSTNPEQLYHHNFIKRNKFRVMYLLNSEQNGICRPDFYAKPNDDIEWLSDFAYMYATIRVSLIDFAFCNGGVMYLCAPILPSNIVFAVKSKYVTYVTYVTEKGRISKIKCSEYRSKFLNQNFAHYWPSISRNPILKKFSEITQVNKDLYNLPLNN
ncbi:MAG: hypothetical protein ABJK37_01305 [Paraglaciecola sp.]|uniref:hypothetical protein n=1 Tax=Paraglaciecola sp. TaxID=1920173 RepID=UPI003298E636